MRGRAGVTRTALLVFAVGPTLLSCVSASTSSTMVTSGGPPSTGEPPSAVVSTTATSDAPTTTLEQMATAPPATAPMATVPIPTLAPITTYDAEIEVLEPHAIVAPVRVRIPSMGIDGGVQPTGVNKAGELAVPDDAKTLVWYRYGPPPGAAGSAVIAGHLDWKGVLGTFNSLVSASVGEHVTVSYDDGSERSFVVRSVELVDKPAVAVNGVFAKDGESVLRLVTCGGEYNRAVRRYYSNVIVTAVPV